MTSKGRTRSTILVTALFIGLALLPACGVAGAPPIPTAPPAPTATPTPAMPTPTPVADVAASDSSAGEKKDNADLFALGEEIFLKTAGGVGCQYCHGVDGKGNVGPNIRGKRPGDIKFALDSIDAMSFFRLKEREIEAVSTYLQFLATQP